MTPEELLADTNRVLHELLQVERTRKEDREKARVDFEAFRAGKDTASAERADALKKALTDRGVPEAIATVPDGEWDARMSKVREQSQQNLKTMEERNNDFRDEVVAELKIQSDLLRQIAARLEG